MGLFGGGAVEEVDPELAALLIVAELGKADRKKLGALGDFIRSQIGPGEVIRGLARDAGSAIAVITSQRVFVVGNFKNKLLKSLPFHEIRKLELGEQFGLIVVKLFPHSYFLDFVPSDTRRDFEVVMLEFDTPRLAQRALDLIAPNLASDDE